MVNEPRGRVTPTAFPVGQGRAAPASSAPIWQPLCVPYALGIASDGEWVAATADDSGGDRRIALRGETTDSAGDIARTLAAQVVSQLGAADASAFAHRDAMTEEDLASLRAELDGVGLAHCALVPASVALEFDRDLAVGAAMWAWQSAQG